MTLSFTATHQQSYWWILDILSMFISQKVYTKYWLQCNIHTYFISFHYRNLRTMYESNLEHIHTCLFDVVCVFQSSSLWLNYTLSIWPSDLIRTICVYIVYFILCTNSLDKLVKLTSPQNLRVKHVSPFLHCSMLA